MNSPQKSIFNPADIGQAKYRFGPRRPSKAKFSPWHKERKQFIRSEHWGVEIGHLLADHIQVSSPVRYFGLPGHDLLDLRFILAKHFHSPAQKLRFLGFDRYGQPEGTEIAPREGVIDLSADVSSLHAVRLLGTVDNQSSVFDHDLARIAEPNSLAHRRFRDQGPFDIINLDLTDGVAGKPEDYRPSMYNALRQMFALQRRQGRPWLLFLTTRVDDGNVHPDGRGFLGGLLRQNIDDCPAFQAKVRAEVPTVLDQVRFASPWTEQATLLGIAKWIVELAVEIGCRTDLRWFSVYTVQSGAGAPDMASYVFLLTPQLAAAEATRISTSTRADVNECAEAAKLPSVTSRPLNVDEHLVNEPQARQQAEDETAALLVETGHYDAAEYRQWLADGAPS